MARQGRTEEKADFRRYEGGKKNGRPRHHTSQILGKNGIVGVSQGDPADDTLGAEGKKKQR